MSKRKEIIVDCDYVRKNLRLHEDGSLSGNNKYLIKLHISECEKCQRYFEELVYTVNLLNNSPSPVPPDGLLGRINSKLERYQRNSLFDWLGYPVSKFFSIFNLELRPIFINSSAFLLYFIVGLFVVKFFFSLNGSDSPHPTEPIVKPRQHIVTLAEIKKSALSQSILDVGDNKEKINIKPENTRNEMESDSKSSEN